MSSKMPVYFVSHGGPNLLDDAEYPPDQTISKGLRIIGDEIRSLNPRGMVVISGHWEAGRTSLLVNGKSEFPQPLIYDFYGFPADYYKQQFPHQVDPQLTQQLVKMFTDANVKIEAVDRGLDHGVWVVLKKAGLANAPFPIVQLSLYRNDSMDMHLLMGAILEPLRDQGVVIVGSGMAVHNLRDLFGPGSPSSVRPYVKPFDKEIEHAILGSSNDRKMKAAMLSESKFLRQAHPSLEHLMPLHVAVGAAGTDSAKKMLEAYQLSLSWSCYRFGNL